MTSGGDDKNRSVVTDHQHQQQPPPPFQGVSNYPPQQQPPATGYPQPAQPYAQGFFLSSSLIIWTTSSKLSFCFVLCFVWYRSFILFLIHYIEDPF